MTHEDPFEIQRELDNNLSKCIISFFPVIFNNDKVEIWGFQKEEDNSDSISLEIPAKEESEVENFKNVLKVFSEKYYGVKKFNEEKLKIKRIETKDGFVGSSWNVSAFAAILKVLLDDTKNLFIATGSLDMNDGNVIIGEVEGVPQKLKKMKEFNERIEKRNVPIQFEHSYILVPNPQECIISSSRIPWDQSKNALTIDDLIALFSENIDDVLNNNNIREVFDYIYFGWLTGKEEKITSVIPISHKNNTDKISIADIAILELQAEKTNDIEGFKIKTERKTREEIYKHYFENPIKEKNEVLLKDFRIFGPGGIGKTTFMKYLHNKILGLIKETYKVRVLPIYLQAKEGVEEQPKGIEDIFLQSKKFKFLILIDGLDEASLGIEDFKQKIINKLKAQEDNIYFVFSSRANIALFPEGDGQVIGFRIEGIKDVKKFIKERYKEIEEDINKLLNNPQLNEVLHIPFYLLITINQIKHRKIDTSKIKFPHQLVFNFILQSLNDSWSKIPDYQNLSVYHYKLVYLSVLGLLAFQMLKEKVGTDLKNLKEKYLDVNPYEEKKYYEIEYNNDLNYIYEECKNKVGHPQATHAILCNLIHDIANKLYENNINIEKSPFVENCKKFLKLSNLEKSGFIINANNNISFSHRIIHESFISLFLTIVFLYLRDKNSWIESIKKLARLEPTNIPGDMDNFEYLAQVVSWIPLLHLGNDEEKEAMIENYIRLFDPESEGKIEDLISSDKTFNYVRLARIIKYLE